MAAAAVATQRTGGLGVIVSRLSRCLHVVETQWFEKFPLGSHMPFFGVEKADSRAPLSFQPAWSKLRTHHVSRISELLVQFLCFCHRKRLGLCLIAGPQLTFEASAGEESCVTRRALDQSSRYADLSLDEDTLIRNGSSLRDSLSKGRQCHACHARQVSFSCLFSFFFQCFFEPSL